MHDHRDGERGRADGAELGVDALAAIGRERVFDPAPVVAVVLELAQERAVERTLDDEVRGDVRVGAHGAAHQIPEAAGGEGHVRGAEGLAAAFPSAERATVALDAFGGEGAPREVAHGGGAGSDAGEGLLLAGAEKDFAGLRGARAEAPAVLHPVLRAGLGVVHNHAGRQGHACPRCR